MFNTPSRESAQDGVTIDAALNYAARRWQVFPLQPLKSGVRAEHLDGDTPKEERDETLRRLALGELQIVTNCMVLTEGWDCPEVSCCILARPTKSMGLFRQMIGRVLRPADGKTDAIVLDHSGAIYQHGLVEDEVEWTLEPDTKAESCAHAKARTNFESSNRLIECSQCGAIREGGKACPHCGFLPQRPPRAFSVHDGDLGLVQNGRAKATIYDDATKRRWWAMLTAIGIERGYKTNWPAVNFKDKFGHYPGSYGATIEPEEPTPEVRSWVKSRMIRYAKSQSAA
jgi:DNA repair protein RadD